MPLDPQLKDVLDLLAASGQPRTEDGTPEQARAAFRMLAVDMVRPEDVVPVGHVEDRTVPGADGELAARLYRPEGEGPWPTLVYFHGGGFVIGDIETHDQTCRRLCAGADCVVLSVDYRLAPEHPFPAPVEDALAATEWAAAHLDRLGGGELLAVGGDSAGGNLAAVVAQELGDIVGAQLLIYPVTDGVGDHPSRTDNAEGYLLTAAMMGWFTGHYVPAGTDLDGDLARLAPLHGDLSEAAPALVVTAEFDPLRDEGEAYADALAAAGVAVDRVRYDGLIHGFLEMSAMSTASAAAIRDLTARCASLLHP